MGSLASSKAFYDALVKWLIENNFTTEPFGPEAGSHWYTNNPQGEVVLAYLEPHDDGTFFWNVTMRTGPPGQELEIARECIAYNVRADTGEFKVELAMFQTAARIFAGLDT